MSCAICSIRGHSAAASVAVMFACEAKFGSLNPRRYFALFGICFSIVAGSGGPPLTPQIIGTNSTPVCENVVATDFSGLVVQLYHQLIPFESVWRSASEFD